MLQEVPATEFWRFGKINPTKSIFAYKPFSFGRPLKWTAIWIFSAICGVR